MLAESIKGGGRIPRFKPSTSIDVIDEEMERLKLHTRAIVQNDPTIKQLIEEWFKKREILEEQEKDLKKAKKQGKSKYILSDKDIIEARQREEEQRQKDLELLEGLE